MSFPVNHALPVIETVYRHFSKDLNLTNIKCGEMFFIKGTHCNIPLQGDFANILQNSQSKRISILIPLGKCSYVIQHASDGLYLSIRVSMVIVCSGVVILLDKAKIFLPLPLENQIPAFLIGRKVSLRKKAEREEIRWEILYAHFHHAFHSCPVTKTSLINNANRTILKHYVNSV